MQAKRKNHESSRRRQAIYLTIAAGLCSAGLVVAMIIICDRSAHLRL